MDKNEPIPKDKVTPQTLREMLEDDEETLEDFEIIDACVQLILFSKYSNRRECAMKTLDNYLPRAQVRSTKDFGLINAYLYLETVDSYIKVGSYVLPFSEPVPNTEEKFLWKRTKSPH